MKLRSTIDSTDVDIDIASAAITSPRIGAEHDIATHYEHGQWWVVCNACGAQWSVVDAEGGDSVGGFDFEQVTQGDELCTED
jgi:hypothetical protein